jgi:hypothetical protein
MFDLKTFAEMVSTLYRLGKEVLKDVYSPRQPILIVENEEPPDNSFERYQAQLGQRHKFLREEILHLNRREMCDFYGYEKTSFLEDCEAGLDEFPTESMQRLSNTFFVSPEFLQGMTDSIFQRFSIHSSEDSMRFLNDGFQPQFLCDPNFNETGYVYLTFYKKEREIWRTIRSNTVGSFHSNEGGALSIFYFIYAMLDSHCSSPILFADVSPDEWEELKHGAWYNKGMIGYSGKANCKASDMFEEWVKSAKKIRV